jgi:hypothetical protein
MGGTGLTVGVARHEREVGRAGPRAMETSAREREGVSLGRNRPNQGERGIPFFFFFFYFQIYFSFSFSIISFSFKQIFI